VNIPLQQTIGENGAPGDYVTRLYWDPPHDGQVAQVMFELLAIDDRTLTVFSSGLVHCDGWTSVTVREAIVTNARYLDRLFAAIANARSTAMDVMGGGA
jgi:hypothetical protein